MSYFTGCAKNIYQDPVRRQTILGDIKPLKDSMLQRIAYFSSTESRKYSFQQFMHNLQNKCEISDSNLSKKRNSVGIISKTTHKHYSTIEGKYNKIRHTIMMQFKDDKDIYSICKYAPSPANDPFDNLTQNKNIIANYREKWKMPEKSKNLLNFDGIKKCLSNYHRIFHHTRNTDMLKKELREISNPKLDSTTYENPKKTLKSWENFKNRQFAHDFTLLSGKKVPPDTELSQYRTINTPIISVDLLPSITPKEKPPNECKPKNKIQITIKKERELSKLFLKGVCRKGYMKTKYLEFQQSVKNSPLSIVN